MAKPGFGKRTVPAERPCRADDFAHLPRREAAIAAWIDRLPEGAAIGIKALATELDYGPCALGTALRRLAEAGHLRRFKELVPGGHWVTRTHFSREPHDDAWWAAYHRGCDMTRWQETAVTPAGSSVPTTAPAPVAQTGDAGPTPERPTEPPGTTDTATPGLVRGADPGRAYTVLARLGETDPRMTLSAADCAALDPLAREWLRRGTSGAQMTVALTAGLPERVHSPRALAENRLTAKMPPLLPSPAPAAGEAPARAALLSMECTVCRAPGSPSALPGGLCRDCREQAAGRSPAPVDAPEVERVRRHAATVRAGLRSGRTAVRGPVPDRREARRADA
ncbi:hypothetical protein [Streptomyces meridianus]|uniref:MarR family transcriptional regulator n=1 Tax=Streptomyces meridianus TaxID=2938945 RepID=A0ABT0X643_9ACTN|nr:hypothetical protein [Streptomyces meridianus]MCM2577996.1 hypothetical protein [Streptomyces meridianus]